VRYGTCHEVPYDSKESSTLMAKPFVLEILPDESSINNELGEVIHPLHISIYKRTEIMLRESQIIPNEEHRSIAEPVSQSS